jgi:CopG family transcriptional regulator / antitoxin EndoAI
MGTKIVNLSFPQDMLNDMDKVAKKEYRTRSELVREAVRRYLLRRELDDIYEYGERQAKKLDLGPEDVADLIADYRAGK